MTAGVGADARASHISARIPAVPPIAQGMTSLARLSGLVMATNAPSRPNAAMQATPMLGLRRAMQPSTMATSAIAPSSSTVWPCAPKCAVMALFSAAGSRSMKTPATALTGEACGRTNAAANVATPIATAAASSPVTAPTTGPRSPGSRPASRPWSARRHQSAMVSGATRTEEAAGSGPGYSSCAR